MKRSSRLLSAGFGLMMVLGLFVAVFSSTASAGAMAPTPTPTLTIDAPTNNTYANHTYMNVTWTVTGPSDWSNVWNWTRTYAAGSDPSAWVNVTSDGYVNNSLADGAWTTDVYAVQWDSVGADYLNSTIASVNYTLDTAGPVSAIDFPTADLETSDVNFTASWTVTDELASVAEIEGRLTNVSGLFDSGWMNLGLDASAPITFFTGYLNLSADEYTLEIRGVDNLTNVGDIDSASFMVTPMVSVLNPTDGSYNPSNITATWDYELLAGTTLDHIEVQLTNSTYDSGIVDVEDATEIYLSALNGGLDLNGTDLLNGTYFLNVTIVDSLANEYTDMVLFYVDGINPEVEIYDPADSIVTNQVNMTIYWEASDVWSGIGHYEVRLTNSTGGFDSGWIDVGADVNVWITNLTAGELLGDDLYTFEVKAFDQAGNSANDAVEILVDTVNPTLEVTYPPLITNDNNPNATWIMNGTGSDIANVEMTITNETTSDVFGPFDLGTANYQVLSDLLEFNLDDGTWTLEFNVTDEAGNYAIVEYQFLVDTLDPTLEVTYPAELTNDNNPNATWIMNGTGSDIANVELTITNETTSDVFGPYDLGAVDYQVLSDLLGFNLDDGTWTLEFNVTDEAGNYAVVDYQFVVDTVSPVVEITAPADGSILDHSNVEITWTCDDPSPASGINHSEVVIDGATPVNVGYDLSYSIALPSGAHTVEIRVYDNASNMGNATVDFTVDTTLPVLTISFPAEGGAYSSNNVSMFWNATDATTEIVNSTWSVDGNAPVEIVGPGPYVDLLLNLSEGSHTITMTAWDQAGNSNSTSLTFMVDTEAPVIDIIFPEADGHYNEATVIGNWTVTDENSGVAKIEFKLDNGTWTNIHWNNTHVFAGLSVGEHTIYLRATDNATNTAEANVTFVIDQTLPTIVSFAPSGVVVPLSTQVVIVFSEAMDTSTVRVVLSPAAAAFGTPTWSDDMKTATYNVDLGASTAFTATVSGEDLAGNPLTGTTVYSFSSLTYVHGVIVDSNGNALANANVTLTSGSSVYYATSNDMGEIGVLVPAGSYSIKVKLSGYDDASKSVVVGPGQAANDLGNVAMTQSMDWTVPIIIVVVGIAAIVVILFLFRRK